MCVRERESLWQRHDVWNRPSYFGDRFRAPVFGSFIYNYKLMTTDICTCMLDILVGVFFLLFKFALKLDFKYNSITGS